MNVTPGQSEAPRGLLLSDDLLFISRITGTARDLGLDVRPARSAAVLVEMARTQPPRLCPDRPGQSRARPARVAATAGGGLSRAAAGE